MSSLRRPSSNSRLRNACEPCSATSACTGLRRSRGAEHARAPDPIADAPADSASGGWLRSSGPLPPNTQFVRQYIPFRIGDAFEHVVTTPLVSTLTVPILASDL